jgi:diguanylate cyclase (GGDEF)-like protein
MRYDEVSIVDQAIKQDVRKMILIASEDPIDEGLVADTVRFELAGLFNERLLASAYVAPFGIGFIAWLQTESGGAGRALLWSTLIVSVVLLTIVFGRGFRNARLSNRPIRPWLNAQLFCSGLLGLVWGSASWFTWAPDKFLFYIITLCVLVGVAFSCMVIMAPLRWAMSYFSLGLGLIPLVQLIYIDNPAGLEIGIGWVMMIGVQLLYAKELRGELVSQIDSSVRNQRLVTRLKQVGQELTRTNSELSLAMEQLNQLVTFDQLTGAYSRRYFMQELDRQVALHARHGLPVSLIMFDLDHFKLINDQHGHSVGDLALREAAVNAKAQLRDGDVLGRVGGEEFLVLLPMTGRESATILAERMRSALAAVRLVEGQHVFNIPASFGVAELRLNEECSSWIRRVDDALYKAKSTGRNRVVTDA